MEDGLVRIAKHFNDHVSDCLNPYCNGRWSRTAIMLGWKYFKKLVLILIVMEDGLVRTHLF